MDIITKLILTNLVLFFFSLIFFGGLKDIDEVPEWINEILGLLITILALTLPILIIISIWK